MDYLYYTLLIKETRIFETARPTYTVTTRKPLSVSIPGGFYGRFFKRAFDVTASIMALIVFAPLVALLAFMVYKKLGAPIIFRQVRPGLHGKLFTMYKFRTMTDERDANGVLLPDAKRLTPFGKFLRSSSLDELPELINVIRGEMSLVGPRPLLVQYLDRYTPEQARRHDVKPGVTGWAQINGRNDIPWEDKFAMDVWYVDHLSFALDIKIMFQTVAKVVRREGISKTGHVTTEEFKGILTQRIGEVSAR